MDSSELRETFFQECEDLSEAVAEGLRVMEGDPSDTEAINSVFRAVHSIKGGAGAFKLDDLVEFAHKFETVLDEVRSNRLDVTIDLMKVLHHADDHLSDLVIAARDGLPLDLSKHQTVLQELSDTMGGLPEPDEEEVIEFVPVTLNFDLDTPSEQDTQAAGGYEISFHPRQELYQSGNDPALLLRELSALGQAEITINWDTIPLLDSFDPEEPYASWRISLETDVDIQAVKEVFEFVDGICELEIEQRLAPEVAFSPDEALPTPLETVEPDVVAAPQPEASQTEPDGAQNKRGRQSTQTIRVSLDRVDRLVNVVGELVIHQAMLTQAVDQIDLAPGSDVLLGLDELRQLSREIQESVMAIRAQPVKPLFQRMFRIVREAGEASGKNVVLQTEGEATEVDKTVFEKLSDPLTHMIRNAIDHGLEPSEKRVAIGKPEAGVVSLTAGHRSGRVIITISDDGGGINRSKVKEIAIEKGLISPDAELTDTEIDNLLFLPGFSTATEVSSLSGRGVGMDVVRSAIQELGGIVNITSVPGVGTSFTISLPLTLAVLDGMVVNVAGQNMVVPLTAIVETLRPFPKDIHQIGDGNVVVAVRGRYLPVIDVGHALGFAESSTSPENKVILIVETEDHTHAALLVDDIQDQRQVVIKSLEENYRRVPGVAAATVFGDGRVALILDTNMLIVGASGPSDQMTSELEASYA